jgi:hypothetical protein
MYITLLFALTAACGSKEDQGALATDDVSAGTCTIDDPHVSGLWVTQPYAMPLNPIEASLLHTGEVLIVAGSENDGLNGSSDAASYRAAIWNPATGQITIRSLTYDVFCSGSAFVPDGRSLIVGGSAQYGPFYGDNRATLFDPVSGAFVETESMADGRWYGTATVLGDGRAMAFSGLRSDSETGTPSINNTVEIYDLKDAGAGWSAPITAPFVPPLFPRMALLPNGRVFFTGHGAGASTKNSWIFDPLHGTWGISAATDTSRADGSAVVLPLRAPSYRPKVMVFGGNSPATKSTAIIDLRSVTPAWTAGPDMSAPRTRMNAVLLPNGEVLAEGGSAIAEVPDQPARTADLYDPIRNAMHSGGTTAFSRLYHSTAVLLPDATVASLGSNPGGGGYQPAIDIYYPPYLFDGTDRLKTDRPVIQAVSPEVIGYGAAFTVSYTSATPVHSAVLVRPGSTTHSSDMDQRLIGICGPAPEPPCTGTGTLDLVSPPNGNVAPPGYYMLFLFDGSGAPSVAKFVQLKEVPLPSPSGSITTPTSNVTIKAGGAVTFATTTVASKYAWVFSGGSPSSSTLQNPGSVAYATPGIFDASLTVIDAHGNSDPHPPHRTITVLPNTPDFTMSIHPEAATVHPGRSASYTVRVNALSGFDGVVTLSVEHPNGLPSGVTSGGFQPPTITGSGTSVLTISTSTSAAPYGASLSILSASGSLHHGTSTTLVVDIAPPTGLLATAQTRAIALRWSPSVGASGYAIQRSEVHGGPYKTIACTIGTRYTDQGLVTGTRYDYVVSALDTSGTAKGGNSAPSEEASATAK